LGQIGTDTWEEYVGSTLQGKNMLFGEKRVSCRHFKIDALTLRDCLTRSDVLGNYINGKGLMGTYDAEQKYCFTYPFILTSLQSY
jgi:hypothetical protein